MPASTGWSRAGASAMHGWHVQSLDLRGRTAPLAGLDAQGAIFLGCTFDDGRGGFAAQPGRPDLSRARRRSLSTPTAGRLYTPQELYSGIADEPLRGHPRRPGLPVEHPAGPAPPRWMPPWPRPCMTTSIGDALDELTRSLNSAAAVPWWASWEARRQRGTAGFAEAAAAGPAPGPRAAGWWPPAAGPAPWRPPTWAPTSARPATRTSRRLWPISQPFPGFRPSVSAWARAGGSRRRTPPGRYAVAGDPHLVLRP